MPSSLLRHRPHRAWSGTGTFYAGEVGILCGGWCNGADFTEISKFPEILGELSMRKQCVPGSFLSAHALEPGNEASAQPIFPLRVRKIGWGRDYSEEVVQVYGICIRTLHLPVISVMIIGAMRLSYNERAVSEGRFRHHLFQAVFVRTSYPSRYMYFRWSRVH